MVDDKMVLALQEAVRHCTAGLKAMEGALDSARSGTVYPTHIHLAAVELAHAIEVSMAAALRNQ